VTILGAELMYLIPLWLQVISGLFTLGIVLRGLRTLYLIRRELAIGFKQVLNGDL
jgi:hypothetical protein